MNDNVGAVLFGIILLSYLYYGIGWFFSTKYWEEFKKRDVLFHLFYFIFSGLFVVCTFLSLFDDPDITVQMIKMYAPASFICVLYLFLYPLCVKIGDTRKKLRKSKGL